MESPSSVAALVLVSALLHAVWNALLKRQRDPEGGAVAVVAVAAVAAGLALPLHEGLAFPSDRGIAWALGAGLCEAGYFATLALAFRAAPLGVVYTVARGGALLAVWPASVAILGEALTGASVAGAAAMLLGLALVGAGDAGRASPRGLGWAGLCALFIAGDHLAYKCSLSTGAAPVAVFAVALAVALPVNLAALGGGGPSRAWRALRASPVVVTAAGLLCAASFLIFLAALARGGAGAAATLRNTSVLFGLLLARLLGERLGRPQIAGTMLVAAGAIIVAWPG